MSAVTDTLFPKEHTESCRAVAFADSGRRVVSGSADRAIAVRDVQEEKILARLTDAHDAAVSRLQPLQENLMASGDEDGIIQTWDWRQKNATRRFTGHSEYISDLTFREAEASLLAVSGDGCLSINDVRTGKVRDVSDGDRDDELTSVDVLKEGKKVICGSQTGVLNIFSWGQFESYSDRFPGHPSSVDAIVKVDEDSIITGSSDGVLRLLSIQPHALVGILGQHAEFGCETIALSHDKRMLASTSYGPAVRLWDTSCLDETEDPEDDGAAEKEPAKPDEVLSSDDEQPSKKRRKSKKGSAKKIKSKAPHSQPGFFKDLL